MEVNEAGKLAITISLYNRWQELGGLLELLRLNWPGGRDLYIIVISTAKEEEMPDWIDRNMVDHFEFESDYEMPKPMFPRWLLGLGDLGERLNNYQRRIVKRVVRTRTVDSIVRGCKQGMHSGRAYTLHLHAATWPFRGEKVYELIRNMKKKGYVFVGRGYGKKVIDEKHPAGDIDDNFFIIDNKFAKDSSFWGFDPALDAQNVCNEGRLARRVYEKAAEEKIFFFDDFSNAEQYDFPSEANQRRIQPFNYFKPMSLLRSHDLTKQAELCRDNKLEGPIIKEIVKTN